MEYIIKNEHLCVTIDSHGAEISSVKNQENVEYIWIGDKKYWGRHAPVLFPVVGKFRDCTYRYENQEYSMGQHGFARDMEFELKGQTEDEIWFLLRADEETKRSYPFAFLLEVGYRLRGRAVDVIWRVSNEDKNQKMYFSIGAHPAFVCPWAEDAEKPYVLKFGDADRLSYRFLNTDGLLEHKDYTLELKDSGVEIDSHFFDESAYVFEDSQLKEVSLVSPEGLPFVTVQFDAPVVGIWSPEKKHAPFVCIEPWYGRCDANDFEGTLEDREWGNSLKPEETFEKSYKMIFQ